jgi:hypothetical protein
MVGPAAPQAAWRSQAVQRLRDAFQSEFQGAGRPSVGLAPEGPVNAKAFLAQDQAASVRAAAGLAERPQASERSLAFQLLAWQALPPKGLQEPERHDARPAQKSELGSEVQQDAQPERQGQPAQ